MASAAYDRHLRKLRTALAEGILIAPGAMFSNAGRFEHFIRLNCGWPYNAEIESAVKCLGQLCAALPPAG